MQSLVIADVIKAHTLISVSELTLPDPQDRVLVPLSRCSLSEAIHGEKSKR